MIKIKTAKRGRNRFGARKYATVPSHTEKNKEYTVAKCRKRAAKHYYYTCTCPYNFYSRKTCKHITDFLRAEKKQINKKLYNDLLEFVNGGITISKIAKKHKLSYNKVYRLTNRFDADCYTL